jgi:hypothetical protein
MGAPRIADLSGLGPATAAWLAAIGIAGAADLAGRDPVAVALALRAAGFPATLNAAYGIAAAQRGCDWRLLPAGLRADLARRWRAGVAERTRQARPKAARRCAP